MKKAILLLLIPALALVMGACERHDWESTSRLHHHGDHGGGHSGGAGEKHGEGEGEAPAHH